jgi:uncharacterized protein YdbL (DUF1318 family)
MNKMTYYFMGHWIKSNLLGKMAFAALCSMPLAVNAQMMGSAGFRDNYRPAAIAQSPNQVFLNDSTVVISAKILANLKPEAYLVTIAIYQEGNTVVECHQKMGEKINGYLKAVKEILPNTQSGVDYIAQTRITDYKKQADEYVEYVKGFRLQKNVLLRTSHKEHIEELIRIASTFEIYDVVKVDYLPGDMQVLYGKLFLEAMGTIKEKKERYELALSEKIRGRSQVYRESLYLLEPGNQYHAYKSDPEQDITIPYNRNISVVALPEQKGLYYEKTSYSGFDKILDAVFVEPPLQAVFELMVVYSYRPGF